MLLFYTPFILLALSAFVRTVYTFARKEGQAEQGEEWTGGRFLDGLLLAFASLLLIFGFVFDGHGVHGGEPLRVYEDTGMPVDVYASLSPGHRIVLALDGLLGFFSYWALRIHHRRLPPIVYVCAHAFLVLFIAWTALYFVHTGFHSYDFNIGFSVLLLQTGSLTMGLLYLAQLKRSVELWPLAGRQEQAGTDRGPVWQRAMHRFLKRREASPLLWSLLTLPVQLAVQLILVLFGQKPDGFVRAFLETSGYQLSKLPAPPPEMIPGDGHYLCTVAARGHRRFVKPLRAGLRHGAVIPINRQLMIANAFEHLLEQHAPAFHRRIRSLYDKYGYPVSRHIRTKVAADFVYLAMKPLEWFFLLVLYTVDARPENRIQTQYSECRFSGCPYEIDQSGAPARGSKG